MARHFAAEVVAEGVERDSVVETLRRSGIQRMQGFLFSTPLTAADAEALVSAETAAASTIDRVD